MFTKKTFLQLSLLRTSKKSQIFLQPPKSGCSPFSVQTKKQTHAENLEKHINFAGKTHMI